MIAEIFIFAIPYFSKQLDISLPKIRKNDFGIALIQCDLLQSENTISMIYNNHAEYVFIIMQKAGLQPTASLA